MFPIDETDHDIEEQSYDGAESVATSKHDESDDACSVEALAEKESQMVRFSKIAVCGVLILVAGLIGFLTFRFVRAQEESTFLSKVSEAILLMFGVYRLSYHTPSLTSNILTIPPP